MRNHQLVESPIQPCLTIIASHNGSQIRSQVIGPSGPDRSVHPGNSGLLYNASGHAARSV